MIRARLSAVILVTCLVLTLISVSAAGQASTPAPRMPVSTEAGATGAAALGVGFTFQGGLSTAAGPVTGDCDLRFSLFNAASGGGQIGAALIRTSVPLTNGLFAVELDFGDVFNGDPRWLEVGVRCPAGSVSFSTLSPRQAVSAAPYALTANRVLNVDTAAGDFTAHGYLISSRGLPEDGDAGGLQLHNTITDNKWHIATRRDNDDLNIGFIEHTTGWNPVATLTGKGDLTLVRNLYINGVVTSNVFSTGVLKSSRGLAEDTTAGALELENTLTDNKWLVRTQRDTDNLEFWFAQGGTSWGNPASLDRAGNLRVAGTITQGAIIERNLQTPAEQVSPQIERFELGDVLCWDPAGQQMERCAQDASPLVVAVADQDGKPIIMGVEPVRVVGPIRAGDLLVASETPGRAVAWSHAHEGYPPPGVILAKALDALDKGEGLVKAMILPR